MRAERPWAGQVVALAFAFGIGRYARRTTPRRRPVVAIRRIRTWRRKPRSPLPQTAVDPEVDLVGESMSGELVGELFVARRPDGLLGLAATA